MQKKKARTSIRHVSCRNKSNSQVCKGSPPPQTNLYAYCILNIRLSHEKNPPTFHSTGCLIGILIMVYYDPYITGQYNPLYSLTNQGFFHCSIVSYQGIWSVHNSLVNPWSKIVIGFLRGGGPRGGVTGEP